MDDPISRQAAIDALNKRARETFTLSPKYEYYVGALHDAGDDIKQIPTIDEPQWVPCSERLPEESGKYLVTVLDGIGRRTTTAPYHPLSKSWTLTGRMTYWKVVAWMELPEPWEGEEHENKGD